MSGRISAQKAKNDILRNRKRILLGAVVAFALVISVETISSWNKVHPGVRVAGVQIGGNDRKTAEEALKSELEPKLKKDIRFLYKGRAWSVSPDKVAFVIDYRQSVEKAFQVGRSGALASLYQRIVSWGGAFDFPVAYRLDEKKASKVLDSINGEIGTESSDAQVSFEGAEPKVTPGKSGFNIDQAKAIAGIRRALVAAPKRTVALELVHADPQIGDAEANDAAAEATKLVASPIVIAYKESGWTLEPTDIASLIRFDKVKNASNWTYRPVVDKERFMARISELTADLSSQPKDARFEVVGDSVRIVPGVNGKKVDSASAYDTFVEATQSDNRKVYVTFAEVEPKLTTEMAQSYGIETQLSEYSTDYSASATARVSNIHHIADAINGSIIAPGETFSVNKAVGPRTAEKGYQEAPVIVNGKLQPGMGGGICQATTTLFNAVFKAGLDVVERTNHAFYISHYPAGLDATVSYGGPDLKFKNDTGHHILVRFSYTSNSVTASIYGKAGLGTEVTSSATPFSNFQGFKTEYTNDPNLPQGTQVVETAGQMGRNITVYRTVKRGGKVIHQDTFASKYDPESAVVRVGTGAPVPTPTPTPTPAPEQPPAQ